MANRWARSSNGDACLDALGKRRGFLETTGHEEQLTETQRSIGEGPPNLLDGTGDFGDGVDIGEWVAAPSADRSFEGGDDAS